MNDTAAFGEKPSVHGLALLREPFPPSQVGKLPRAGITLDYVGHGAVTARLLDVDDCWSWDPVAFDVDGSPLVERDGAGKPVGLWIRLTVCGVTRYGYGSCAPGQFEAVKVLIGDALRNAAMRFGVALDLWIKGQGEDDEKVSAAAPAHVAAERPLCAACGLPLTGTAKIIDGRRVHSPDCPSQDPM